MTPQIAEAKTAIESKSNGRKPAIGIVLGSGLGSFAEKLEDAVKIPYGGIPGFRPTSVPGHAGQLLIGAFRGKTLAVLQGRSHIYEGCTAAEVAFPIRALGALGVKTLLTTCAAGGINSQLRVGSLMAIEDHINFTGENPLISRNSHEGEAVKFLDMTQAYSSRLLEKLTVASDKLKLGLRRGVYMAVSGPNYETPSETKAMAWLGADAIGMSVVPEVLVARHLGMEVAGLALITNLAAGIGGRRLSHEEVLETTRKVSENFVKLLEEFIASL
ncbi:MAG: purine-nucleoside phosphorylase [Verrucomicrobia bacterium]|nr:purine-nucleoside phosphorylase [Verrucomicrobiota bacterium]